MSALFAASRLRDISIQNTSNKSLILNLNFQTIGCALFCTSVLITLIFTCCLFYSVLQSRYLRLSEQTHWDRCFSRCSVFWCFHAFNLHISLWIYQEPKSRPCILRAANCHSTIPFGPSAVHKDIDCFWCVGLAHEYQIPWCLSLAPIQVYFCPSTFSSGSWI